MNTTLPDPDPDGVVLTADMEESPGLDRGPSRFQRVRSWLVDLVERPDDGIVGGVAIELADRLGVDVLWIRLGLVVSLLLGGVGGLLYVGLWLGLIVGRERPWARIAGGVTLFAVPLVIANARPSIATGTGAMVILLVGLTLALWNRNDPAAAPAARVAVRDEAATVTRAIDIGAIPAPTVPAAGARRERGARVRTRRRPPSILGRATVGTAVIVAATGALIDELNGGRTHPEQWLGAAAVVCGLGLLVGAFRGHARWLVLPAVAFAAVGFLAGELAEVGLHLTDVGGDEYVYVSDGPGGSSQSSRSAFGSTYVDITAVPLERAEIEVLSAFGDVQISTTDQVTIELIADIDDGGVRIDGRSVGGGTHRIGPEGDPDVVIDARVVNGDINVWSYDPTSMAPEFESPDTATIDRSATTVIGEGVVMTEDGAVVILDGHGVIDRFNQPLIGANWFVDAESGDATLTTEFGTWQLVGGILISPFGQVFDLDAIRNDQERRTAEELLDEVTVTTAVPQPVPPIVVESAPTLTPLPTVPGRSGDPITTVAQQEG